MKDINMLYYTPELIAKKLEFQEKFFHPSTP